MRRSQLANFALVHNDVVAAAIAPDAEQGHLVLHMLGHPHGFLGVLDRMPVDFLDDVALLETGFGSGRVGLDLGDDHTFNVLRDLELLPGLLEKKGSPIAWVIWGVDSDSSIVWDAGMPRKLRMEYPGAMYHVMSRGDRRERIFLDDVDREEAQDRRLSYPWSSFGAYLAAPEHRPGWVRVDRLLGEHGIQEDTPASRAQFEQWMERRRLEETDREALKVLRRGWCWGGAGSPAGDVVADGGPAWGASLG